MNGEFAQVWSKTLEQFPRAPREPERGYFIDFLGVRTRVEYFPPNYADLAGTVEGVPHTERAGIHDPREWAGILRAAIDARERFTCIELGAGWGPFVVGAAAAAIQRGIAKENISLTAVEGAASHVAFIRQHFRDNDLDPEKHLILCAAAGAYDGIAQFPRLTDPSLEWGGEAQYDRGPSVGRTPQRTLDAFDEVPCLSIEKILSFHDIVDVIHFDIQGAEADAIAAGIEALERQVRRIVVGTHGRDIEQQLLTLLDRRGWVLEIDKPSLFSQVPPHAISVVQDGVQVWKNPGLVASPPRERHTLIERLQSECQDLRSKCERAAADKDRLQADRNALQQDLDRVLASKSWRFTEPMRSLRSLLNRAL